MKKWLVMVAAVVVGTVFSAGIEAIYEAAEKGDAKAQFELGRCYMVGEGGVDEDRREAAKWYEKSAKQGYADAQVVIGLIFADYCKRTYNRAGWKTVTSWFEKAAKQGHPLAECHMAWHADSLEEQEKFARKSAERGFKEGFLRLGQILVEKGNKKEAAKCFYLAFKTRDYFSREHGMDMRTFFLRKYGMEKFDMDTLINVSVSDALLVRNLCEKSLAQCGPYGTYYIGLIGLEAGGYDVKSFFKSAADAGIVDACFELGKIYQNEKKTIDTLKWYRKAAQKGHKGAQEELKKMGKTW